MTKLLIAALAIAGIYLMLDDSHAMGRCELKYSHATCLHILSR